MQDLENYVVINVVQLPDGDDYRLVYENSLVGVI